MTNRSAGAGRPNFEFTPSCEVCRKHTHAKWHDVARGPINPVALIQYVEGFQDSVVTKAIVNYILTVTGIDRGTMRKALEAEADGNK